MAKSLPVAALIVVLTCVVFLAIGWGLIYWRTSDPSFLDRAETPASVVISTGSSALDAAIGSVTQTSNSNDRDRLDQMRKDTQRGLIQSYAKIIAIIGLAGIAWTVAAWLRAPRVGGVAGMRSAQKVWIMGLLVVLAGVCGLLWWTFKTGGVGAVVVAPATATLVIGGIAVSVLCYWVATALAAPTVLRTSVPLGTILVRVRGNGR